MPDTTVVAREYECTPNSSDSHMLQYLSGQLGPESEVNYPGARQTAEAGDADAVPTVIATMLTVAATQLLNDSILGLPESTSSVTFKGNRFEVTFTPKHEPEKWISVRFTCRLNSDKKWSGGCISVSIAGGENSLIPLGKPLFGIKWEGTTPHLTFLSLDI